jgi:hypothetical protein
MPLTTDQPKKTGNPKAENKNKFCLLNIFSPI